MVTDRAPQVWLAAALLCLFAPVRAPALDPEKSLDQYNCKTWTRRETLPAGSVNAIAQTPDGQLWLGTDNGLVRFDGLEFKRFTLPDLIQFKSGEISKSGGFPGGRVVVRDDRRFARRLRRPSFFCGHQCQWRGPRHGCAFPPGGQQRRRLGGGANRRGRLCPAGTTNFISFGPNFRGGMSLGVGPQGRIWAGTSQSGLYYWQGGQFNRFPDEEVNRSIVFAVTEDAAGRIWVGTETGLRCYDAGFHRQDIGGFYTEVRSLLVDRQGVVWIGTSGDGLLCCKNGSSGP